MAYSYFMLAVIAVVSSVCFQEGNSTDIDVIAAGMLQKMNLSANPCQNFHEYACGRFTTETVIPAGRSKVSIFRLLLEQNRNTIHGIIVNESNSSDPRYLSNARRFYKSCLDEAKIEALGISPFLKNNAFVDNWPTLNPDWNGAKFDLNEVIVRYMKVVVAPIFSFSIFNDLADSNKHALYLLDGHLGLQQEFYSGPRNDSFIQAYQKYLAEIAVALNANREVAERDAKDVVDLEIELAKIMVPRQERRNYAELYNPVNLGNLSKLYPELDIARVLRAVFQMVNISLSDDEEIINFFPSYIGNLSSVLRRFSNRTQQNLFAFHYADQRAGRLNKRMRQIVQDINKVFAGTGNEQPREEFCVEITSHAFQMAISKQFVTRTFSETAKHHVNEMIDNLKEEFKLMIKEATWMSDSTKNEAINKLTAMKRKIGYPDQNFAEADIEIQYDKYIMKEDDYYNNCELTTNIQLMELMALVRTPVDKSKWDWAPHDVNAVYTYLHNDITFLAGIMQTPFFSETAPHYLNYGAIGSVIGHEITHGFDDKGSQYDANGNLRNWWTTEDSVNFKNRTECMVDKNSKVYVSEINMTLNGINTQGESESDIGGLKQSFRAYKEQVNSGNVNQPTLPGLQLSPDQLFFLSFAQMDCERMTKEAMINAVTSQSYPPGKYRINGNLQNSEDFARVYNCTPGSFMNPEKKCSVW